MGIHVYNRDWFDTIITCVHVLNLVSCACVHCMSACASQYLAYCVLKAKLITKMYGQSNHCVGVEMLVWMYKKAQQICSLHNQSPDIHSVQASDYY